MEVTPRQGLLRGTLYFLGGMGIVVLITLFAVLINVEMLPYFFLPISVYLFYVGYQKSKAPFTEGSLRIASFIILLIQIPFLYLNYVLHFFIYLNASGMDITYWNLLTYRVPSYMADNDGGILSYFIGIVLITIVLYVVSITSLKSAWLEQQKGDQ